MQANEAPQERMSAAWRWYPKGYEPRRGSVMVKTIDAATTDRLRRSPLYLDLSPSCARKRACMELTTICRFQRLLNPSFRLFQCFRYVKNPPPHAKALKKLPHRPMKMCPHVPAKKAPRLDAPALIIIECQNSLFLVAIPPYWDCPNVVGFVPATFERHVGTWHL